MMSTKNMKNTTTNPIKTFVKKAVLTDKTPGDCCYVCNKYVPKGTRAVVVTLHAPNIAYYGKNYKIVMHEPCWKKLGSYPPVQNNPQLKKNPPLVKECKLITKGPSKWGDVCQYCGEKVEEGTKVINTTVSLIDGGVIKTVGLYIHIPCWEKSGRYPPLTGEKRKLPKGPQMPMADLNPIKVIPGLREPMTVGEDILVPPHTGTSSKVHEISHKNLGHKPSVMSSSKLIRYEVDADLETIKIMNRKINWKWFVHILADVYDRFGVHPTVAAGEIIRYLKTKGHSVDNQKLIKAAHDLAEVGFVDIGLIRSNPGKYFMSASGRRLSPPEIRLTSTAQATKDLKRAQKWALEEAIKELEPKLGDPSKIEIPGSPEADARFKHKRLTWALEDFDRWLPIGTLEDAMFILTGKHPEDFSKNHIGFPLVTNKVPTVKNEYPAPDKKFAVKFRQMADGMQKDIDKKRDTFSNMNITARRARFQDSASKEADKLEKAQQAMRNMADAIDAGTLPPELNYLKNRAQVQRLIAGYPNSETAVNEEEFKAANELIQQYIKGPSEEVIRARKIKEIESKFIGTRIPGFFPTPPLLVAQLLQLAAPLKTGMKVLEPSAGKGDIADAVKAACPNCILDLVEINHNLYELLQVKAYGPNTRVIHADFLQEFLQFKPRMYDRIIMNPPFEKNQDIEHIMYAYSLLAPGGRLVSVISGHPFFASDKPSRDFREWLKLVNGKVITDSKSHFKGAQSFRQTGVVTNIIVINKPKKKASLTEMKKYAYKTMLQFGTMPPAALQSAMKDAFGVMFDSNVLEEVYKQGVLYRDQQIANSQAQARKLHYQVRRESLVKELRATYAKLKEMGIVYKELDTMKAPKPPSNVAITKAINKAKRQAGPVADILTPTKQEAIDDYLALREKLNCQMLQWEIDKWKENLARLEAYKKPMKRKIINSWKRTKVTRDAAYFADHVTGIMRAKNPMSDGYYIEIDKIVSGYVVEPFAIQYLTDMSFREEDNDQPVRIKLPDGSIIDRYPDTVSRALTTDPHWVTWKEFKDPVTMFNHAMDFLRSDIHNARVGHPWQPIRLVSRTGKTIDIIIQWDTMEKAVKFLSE